MSEYQMRMHLRPGSLGHMAVELTGPGGQRRVVGFGPARGGLKSIYGQGDAVRKDDFTKVRDGFTNASAPVSLTKEQFDRFTRFADDKAKMPPDYFALGDNCVQFALDGMTAAGVEQQDLAMKFPPKALAEGGAAAEMLIRRSGGLAPDERADTGNNQDTYDYDRIRARYVDPEARERWLKERGGADPAIEAPPAKAEPEDGGKISSNEGAGFGLAGEAEATQRAMNYREQNGSSEPADPRIAALAEMSASPLADPARSALLKDHRTWTEAEMKDVLGTAQGGFTGWRSGDPMKAFMYERAQDWHSHVYGDGEQQYDGGRPVAPQPLAAIPDQPAPHVTPQGEDLWQATGRLGGKVAAAAQADGPAGAVTGLQRDLNLLGDSRLGTVAEDGLYGPQTDFALKHAMSSLGPAKVENAFALGRFNTFARNAQANGAGDGLENATHAIFGPLLRGSGDHGPKIEAGVLQETLNGLGPRHFPDWQDLKVDDWIGPKTTEVFGKLLDSEGADGLTEAFGKGLGFVLPPSP